MVWMFPFNVYVSLNFFKYIFDVETAIMKGNNQKDFDHWVQFSLSLVGGGHKLIIQYTLRYCRPTKHSLPLTKLTNQSSEWKVG